jgi:NTP pyrophosphatase (non-canonical NTP hydrolase)
MTADEIIAKLERRESLFTAIAKERDRQDGKWGGYDRFNAPHTFATILGEEFGEVCKASLENDDENLVDELVQVAAVAVAWLEQIERERVRQFE